MRKSLITLCAVFITLASFLSINSSAIGQYNIKLNGNGIEVDSYGYDEEKSQKDDLKVITSKIEEYKEVITFLGGLATITMVAIFIKHFIKLGVLGTEHWAVKRSSIMGLLWSGIAAILLGSSTLVFAISYNLFN